MANLANSEAAFARAQLFMPGGNTRASNFETPHPIYMAAGKGAYVTDIDGNRYLDFRNNFTALIHGYNHPGVTAAVQQQALSGLSFANPTLSEIALAELLTGRVRHFERIRFTNTGSEAVIMTIKAARALTGRRLIAKCEGAYHGNYDVVEFNVSAAAKSWRNQVAPQPEHAGVARSAVNDCILIPFNDSETTKAVLEPVAGDLAAVIIDPLPSRLGLMPIEPEYLGMLRRLTSLHGALLISDEVLSFRLGLRGGLDGFGVTPDLCAFGKIIGGGMSIGAVAGSSDNMAVFDPHRTDRPRVVHSGTFTATPMAMTAGYAAMQAMRAEDFDRLNMLGAKTRQRLNSIIAASGLPGTVTGKASLFRIFLGRQEIRTYADVVDRTGQPLLNAVVCGMRQRGVLLSQIGLGALSTPMVEEDIEFLCRAFAESLDATKSISCPGDDRTDKKP